jgi:cellulose synthase/poly-beta-1,6-N-acetylglucosamine synthase-like glycosyltransferase
MSSQLVNAIEWTFLAYFAAINAAYLAQCLLAVFRVRRYLKSSAIDELDPAYSTLHLPISLVVPAYNESKSIVTSVKALLQLEYPDFEVVVVNDGSTDDTLEKLVGGFQLYRYPEAYRKQVHVDPSLRRIGRRAIGISASSARRTAAARPTRRTPVSTFAAIRSSPSSMRTACSSATP